MQQPEKFIAASLYDNQLVLLYSEIDPALHTAVARFNLWQNSYKTTINYVPKYFLVNGTPFVGGTTADIQCRWCCR